MITKNNTKKNETIYDWKYSLKNSFHSWEQLAKFLELNTHESLIAYNKKFPLRVSLSFAKRMEKKNIDDPLLKQVLLTTHELNHSNEYIKDPLNETMFNPLKGLLHKYKNRVLLILHSACAIHCRYCFRKEFDYKKQMPSKLEWNKVFEYINNHSELDEVIFSGGDPLMHNDITLKWFIKQIEKIIHIKRLRIHTRIPIILPNRITDHFLSIFNNTRLQKIMVIHVNHPNEIIPYIINKMKLLRNIGFILLNQSTLLKNINDNTQILKNLSEKLIEAEVIPYYLHILDKVEGTMHFNVPINEAKNIIQELKSSTSGFLVPKLVQEIPNKCSKTWISF